MLLADIGARLSFEKRAGWRTMLAGESPESAGGWIGRRTWSGASARSRRRSSFSGFMA